MDADDRRLGAGCLVIFGLPFLLGGLVALVIDLRSWLLYAQSASWKPVPATVLSVEFVEEGVGEDETYHVDATYRYDYGGITYTGHRVGVMGGSSNYAMHRRRYEELEAAQLGGKPVTALVSPHDPADALIYHETETWLFILLPFGLVFAGVGGLLVSLGVRAMLPERQAAGVVVYNPRRAWDMREDWAEGRVRASIAKDLLFYWGVGLGLSAFMSIFVGLALESAGPFVRIIVGLISLVPAFMVLKALALTLSQIVYGTPVLYLSEVPIVPGRKVLGAVRTRGPLPAGRLQVRARCYTPIAAGDSSSATKRWVGRLTEQVQEVTGQPRSRLLVNWRGQCACSLNMEQAGDARVDSAGRSMLPICIEVPAGVPETSLNPGSGVDWVLAVKGWSFPAPFSANFDLPVFYADEGEVRHTARKGD